MTMEQTVFAIRDSPRGIFLRDPDLFVWELLCAQSCKHWRGPRQAIRYFHVQCFSASPKIMANKWHNCCYVTVFVPSALTGEWRSNESLEALEIQYRHVVNIQHMLLLFVALGSFIFYKYCLKGKKKKKPLWACFICYCIPMGKKSLTVLFTIINCLH